MKMITRSLRELLRYPSAIAGLVIILILVVVAIGTVIFLPYQKAITLWRGGVNVWNKLPQTVPPAWINYFRSQKLPDTLVLSSADGQIQKTVTSSDTGKTFEFVIIDDFYADDFPQEITLNFTSNFSEKKPFVDIYWETPDGREIHIGNFGIDKTFSYRLEQDEKLKRRLKGLPVHEGLFVIPDTDPPAFVKGRYTMKINAVSFEKDSNVDVEFIQYGLVYGLAGTDYLRRDITIALLWGIPVALSFGLLAALGTTLSTMIIAAVGTWFGGWVDELIQRITEVNLLLPFLPILIMIGTFYSRSIVVILSATILLSIFGGAIKGYRSIFMQIREAPYIEAARSYGAGNIRIIFNYLVPRIIPLIIPSLVSGIPAYVFLEASLAVLGLGDPVLPTWGKLIQDASSNGALYQGNYYWILEPSILLMITGLAFAMLGFALDRIFNPRLREI